ncbi:MAG: ATP-binding cassette domain-containing protein [Firmicutes bacterium]|nr:ATP-binding cassette domain-containing protein [Bacillota bacterium]
MIELKNITKIYKDKKGREVHALNGVSYKFPKTGLIFLVGKSGSGKSTMLNILGLLDAYTEGNLLIGGKDSATLSARERDTYRALNIGFVFQDFHIIEKYTISQNISLALEISNQEASKEQITSALEKVGLAGFENRFAHRISGGQKQRVAIARAIVKSPAVILADEPTGNLDSVTSGEIFTLLRELAKESLVIVISHDTESAHKYAEQIVELEDGKIKEIISGGGYTETVHLSSNAVDGEEINKLISENKRVIIVKKTELPKEAEPWQAHPVDLSKKTRLPLKSSFKITMLSVKAKWIRMVFTVLLSMFSIAFFGFADMVAQYSTVGILAQELERSELPFVPVALMETKDYSVLQVREKCTVDKESLDRFRQTGLEFAEQYSFSRVVPLSLATPFPDTRIARHLWDDKINGVIETPNAEFLGLNVVGDFPQNTNEVMITNYMLEIYKRFGAKLWTGEEWTETAINSFEDIRGGIVPTWSEVLRVKIVGMVEFDLSLFEQLAELALTSNRITDEIRALLPQVQSAKTTHLNNYFALPGFFKGQEAGYRTVDGAIFDLTLTLPNEENTTGITVEGGMFHIYGESFFSPTALHPSWLPPANPITSFNTVNFKSANLKGRQVVMSIMLLLELIPEELHENYFDLIADGGAYIDFYMGEKHLGEFEIIATYQTDHNLNQRTFYPSLEFYEFFSSGFPEAEPVSPNIILVPAVTAPQRLNVLNRIESLGTWGGLDEFGEQTTLSFALWGGSAQLIYHIDNMFSLFISVFRLASLLFAVFAMLITYSFIAGSIKARKRDIGILRSLGASQKDIAGVFITEGAIIAVLKIIFSSLLLYLGFVLLNRFFISKLGYIAETYTLVSFTFRQVLLMGAVTIAGVAMSIFLPILQIARKQPVEVIREVTT